jgi:hypothetical protein
VLSRWRTGRASDARARELALFYPRMLVRNIVESASEQEEGTEHPCGLIRGGFVIRLASPTHSGTPAVRSAARRQVRTYQRNGGRGAAWILLLQPIRGVATRTSCVARGEGWLAD